LQYTTFGLTLTEKNHETMKKKNPLPGPKKTRSANQKKVTHPPEDPRKGFGILPDRDLKKNLGCG
jgi:hypothetical protein